MENTTRSPATVVPDPAGADSAERTTIDVVAHDLRGALVPAKTYAQLLLAGAFGSLDERQLDAVKTIDHCLQKQEYKIDSVLDMIKAQEQRLELQLASENMGEIVQSAIDSVQRDSQRKNLKFVADVDPRAALLNADARRLRRILVVLMGRAIKQTSKGGRLGAELKYTPDARARIRLWDAGNGNDPEELNARFKPAREQLAHLNGNGFLEIDLVSVFDIIHAHGGSISAQSNPGAGTTYLIYLPVELSARARAALSVAGEDARPTTSAPHVLMAGFNDEDAQRLRGALESHGAETTLAPNGIGAVLAARERHYETVLINGSLPELDSATAAAAIRAQRPEDRQSIYVISDERIEIPGCVKLDTAALADAAALAAKMVGRLEPAPHSG